MNELKKYQEEMKKLESQTKNKKQILKIIE